MRKSYIPQYKKELVLDSFEGLGSAVAKLGVASVDLGGLHAFVL